MQCGGRASSVGIIPAVKESRLPAELKHALLLVPQGMFFAVTRLAEHLQIVHILGADSPVRPVMHVQPLRGAAPFALVVRFL
jgi:hypothetical protein